VSPARSRTANASHAPSATALLAVVLVAAVLVPHVAAAEPLPRAAHVARALAAVRALGPEGREQLERTLYAATRGECRADAATPAVSCLIAAARAACAADRDRSGCEAAADVVVTNLRAANAWVDEPTRIRLVRGSTDYRVALAGELHRRFAALAAELVLGRGGSAGEADAIDRLCAERDREVHACAPGDTACVASVPWSRCAAALVWFVGGSP
jgi:hypothetical protein